MKLHDLFKKGKTVLTDGAMGTYFSVMTGLETEKCEKMNVLDPDTITKIHKEYVDAGAKILRTNTFSANSILTGGDRDMLSRIIRNGYKIAVNAANEDAVVCADISALYENPETDFDIEEEYRFIADCFLDEGAEVFIFETLSDLSVVMPAIDYILSRKKDAEIIVSFTLLPDRCTRSGVSAESLLKQIETNKDKLSAVGLNCGIGAVQLYSIAVPFFSYIQKNTGLFTLVMPNSGYPYIVNRKTVYSSRPEYFAEQTARFLQLGVNALGGCCGTDPVYIRRLGEYIEKDDGKRIELSAEFPKTERSYSPAKKRFLDKEFIIAAELDPPDNSDFSRILSAARKLKDSGVDIITVSDSPLGHAKADPVFCSARIRRDVGIETLPHLCCRDRNINAIRSVLFAAHSEGIRSVLAVTGDPIAETDRGIIKPVFNMDSVKLMKLMKELNDGVFASSPFIYGGAFDPAAHNSSAALNRLDKKIECGASFVLTQPVFTDKAIDCIKEAKKKNIRILAGIMPMVSLRNALFMKNEVPGMVIPDELVERFKPDMTRDEAQRAGVEIAAETARKLKPYVDGFYFVTPFNRADVVADVIKKL